MWTAKTVQEIPTSPKLMGIYQITNIINCKRYIGKSKDIRKRWMGHIHSNQIGKSVNKHFQYAWDKHGEDNFTFHVLEIVTDESQLGAREKLLVEEHRSEYNVAIVEDGQWTMTEKESLRRRNLRLNASSEWNKKIGDALRGKKKSEEHTRKMRESLTGRKATPEQIEKIRKSSTGRPVPDYAKKENCREGNW
jgi:group I intron endonuclease